MKKLIGKVLEEVNMTGILLFQALFLDGELHKAISNNPFQTVMNYLIDDFELLPRIFAFLEKGSKGDMEPIVRVLKFVSSKCSTRIDITQKYLKTLTKYPELYESLL